MVKDYRLERILGTAISQPNIAVELNVFKDIQPRAIIGLAIPQ